MRGKLGSWKDERVEVSLNFGGRNWGGVVKRKIILVEFQSRDLRMIFKL